MSWVREQCIRLARYTRTDIPFFLDMTLHELCAWIRDVNAVIEEDNRQIQAQLRGK